MTAPYITTATPDSVGPELQPNGRPDPKTNLRRYQRIDLDLTEVRPILSEGKCKICSHPSRKQIDILIYRQRMKDLNDEGQPFTRAYLMQCLLEIGVPNPNTMNVKTHWNKHCEVPNREQVKIEKEQFASVLEKLTTEQITSMSRQDLLDTMMRQGIAEAGARLRATGKSGITVDAILKIAELQIREKGSEAQNEFLKALGGGIVAAVKNGIPAPQAKQLANAEVIVDADVVEIEAPIEAAA